MIDIEIGNMVYKLPTDYSEITLGKYMDIMKIDKDIKEVEKLMNIISILSEISINDVRNIGISQIKLIQKSLMFLFESKDHIQLQTIITINGKKYGFNRELNNISIGEFTDLDTFSKSKDMEQLDYLMAVLYRPIDDSEYGLFNYKNIINKFLDKEDYRIKDYETNDFKTLTERKNLFREYMTIDIVLSSMFFFIILRLVFIQNMEKSLTPKQMEMFVKEKMIVMGIYS